MHRAIRNGKGELVESDTSHITYPGLAQGSPLSPMLYILFNTGLVDKAVSDEQGAFLDDYTRWVVSGSIDQNMETLQTDVIPSALKWAAASGAAFKDSKTTLIHFICDAQLKRMLQPLQAGSAWVPPSSSTKVLGVMLDNQLTFRDHLAQVAHKAWHQVRMLPRLRELRPGAVRQLYQSIVLQVWTVRQCCGIPPTWVGARPCSCNDSSSRSSDIRPK